MSGGQRYGREQALEEVRALLALCVGTYDTWTVAGSLRRGRLDVGDAEHVVIPKMHQPPAPEPIRDLFGNVVADYTPPKPRNLLIERLDQLLADGQIKQAIKSDGRTRWGDRYRALVLPGNTMHHELWMGDTTNYGALLAIRTGPQEIGITLVTRLRRVGVAQHEGYLRKVETAPTPAGGFEERYGDVVPVPDEETYFKLAGFPKVPDVRDRDNLAQHLRRTHG